MKMSQAGIFLGVGSMLLGMVWAWSIARDAAWEDMLAVNNQIREVTFADAVLDLEVLRIRSGVVDHYDDVTKAADLLRQSAQDLQNRMQKLHLMGQEVIQLNADLAIKLNAIETLKSQNSILRNSESYLPALLDDYARQYQTDQSTLQSLLLRTLVLTDQDALQSLRIKLQTLAPGDQVWNLNDVRSRVAMHGGKFLDVRQSIQPMLQDFLSIPVHEDISRIHQTFNQEQAERERTRERFRSLLYVSAFGFFLLSIVILRRFIRLNRKTRSFVPFEMLDLLGKKTLMNIEYGTSTQREMTVMFVDLRDFSRSCEGRPPADNFAFVNEYLAAITPAIQNHRGFVAQFTGDGAMALFAEQADDALAAATDLIKALSELNDRRAARGEDGLYLGIGINTSELMLGTIGHHKRMECTVLGNGVNIAARVEGLTRTYGCNVLLTESTVKRLQKRQAFGLRNIDQVRPKGLQEPLQLFELLDAGDPQGREQKTLHEPEFQKARQLYRQRRFREAGQIFGSISSHDPVSQFFKARCELLATDPPPDSWDGVADFSSK